MGAEQYIGKKVTFFLKNKQVTGKVVKFKLPGYLVKGPSIPEGTKLPAMCMQYLKVEA